MRSLLALLALLLVAPALAQTRQPANVSTLPQSSPQEFDLLDKNGNWLPFGAADNGVFAPVAAFSPLAFGAKCDGTTDDSVAVQAAATAALAAGGGNISGVEGKTCVAGNIEIGAGVVVRGGTYKSPTTGANFIFHLTGSRAGISGVKTQDGDGSSHPTLNLMAKTTITSPLTASVTAAGVVNAGSGYTNGTCAMVDHVTNGVASTPAQFSVTVVNGAIASVSAVTVAGSYTTLPGQSVGNNQQIFSAPVDSAGTGGCGSGTGATLALTFTTSTSVTVASTAATATAPKIDVGQRFAIRSDDGIWSSGMIIGVSGNTITLDRAPRHPSTSGMELRASYGAIYVGGAGAHSGVCSNCVVENLLMTQGGLMVDGDTPNSTGFFNNIRGYTQLFCVNIGRSIFGWQASHLDCGTVWNPGDTYIGDGTTQTFATSQRLRKVNGDNISVNGVRQPVFNGTISGTTLTVTGSVAGAAPLTVGTKIYASPGIMTTTPATQITALGTGTGGNGTYTVNNSQIVVNATPMTGGFSITSTGLAINFSDNNVPPSGASIVFSYQAMSPDGIVINGPGPIVTNAQALGFDRAFYITGFQSPQMSDLIADASIEACFSMDGSSSTTFGGANSVGFCDTGFYMVNNSHASFRTTSGNMFPGITPQGQANLMIAVDGNSAVNDGEWTVGGANYYRAISYQSAYTQMNEIAVNSFPVPQYGIGCPISGAVLPGIWNYCGNTGDHVYFNANAHILSFDGVDAALTAANANTINAPGVPAVLELRAMAAGSQINLSANNAITFGVATTSGGNGFPAAIAVVNPWGLRFAAPTTYANLIAPTPGGLGATCDTAHRGLALISDSNTNAVGWPIAGSGTFMVLGWCSGGSNSWSVAASSTLGAITGWAIANLPACDTGHKGLTTYVNNAPGTLAAPTAPYGGTPSAVGTALVQVFCNGSNWQYS